MEHFRLLLLFNNIHDFSVIVAFCNDMLITMVFALKLSNDDCLKIVLSPYLFEK
jgi:hypothetical protein